ncbi:hypothetical protein ACIBL3_16265 [Kribbella sp. NPDC050124]|uniref:hypothetical protein n=1 Tax=Kribbella sp. NPDC050124 TaxID=3364114 RepID=UPI0037948434
MRFFVLGPIHVRVGGAVPSLAAPTLRILLGCLLAALQREAIADHAADLSDLSPKLTAMAARADAVLKPG